MHVQRRFFDHHDRPDALEQIVLGDEVPRASTNAASRSKARGRNETAAPPLNSRRSSICSSKAPKR